MSLRARLALPVILSALAVLSACGGGNSNPPVNPPPSGSFGNSNLSGNYAFSVTGTAADQTNDFVTIMGSFTADGNGNITGGVLDQNSTAANGLILDTITSGTYSVGADGRPAGTSSNPTGLLTLQTQNSGQFQFDYVLTSSTHGLLTQFETQGSASGSLDLQADVSQADIGGRSYAFNLTGSSGFGNSVCGFSMPASVPFATVGAFTLDSNGNVVSGVEDFNNNCISSGSTNLAITGGDIDLSTFPGTAALTTGTGGSAITYTFDVYPIDATHLKFIEIDAQPMLVGDAFTQTTSIPAGNNVFTIAGFDIASNVGGPFTAAGIFDFDSNGNIKSDSVEDINDALVPGTFGSIAGTAAITAISTPLTGGRTELTFVTGFVNGNDGVACSSNCIFAAYPSSGGLQLLEIDDGGITSGVAYAQSASTLASGEGYGMNQTGIASTLNGIFSEDDIAEFTNNNGRFSGIIDINQQGAPFFKNAFSADYSADTTVAGRGSISPNNNGYFLTTYVVDNSTAVAVSSDNTFVGLGALVQQNSSAKSNAVANHLTVLRANASAHMRNSTAKKASQTHSSPIHTSKNGAKRPATTTRSK